jgi:formamidopyrimidine-DNA glycosylase
MQRTLSEEALQPGCFHLIKVAMPELPEVETIARRLREEGGGEPSILGRTVHSAEIRWPRHIASPVGAEFLQTIAGQSIDSVGRRGKFLILGLSGGFLLIHLRMSGDLYVVPAGGPLGKHDHTVWHLSGGMDLRFHDPRKFGRVWLTGDPTDVLARLGPEPLAPEFTAARLGRMLRARRRQLKPLLLDQTFLAGLGNIYADESLFRARLHPLRRSDSLHPAESARLWRAIRGALREGIIRNGASIDWVYHGGKFQNHFRVYGRAGKPCGRCGTAVRRMIVGQRSTFLCPRCQPKRG